MFLASHRPGVQDAAATESSSEPTVSVRLCPPGQPATMSRKLSLTCIRCAHSDGAIGPFWSSTPATRGTTTNQHVRVLVMPRRSPQPSPADSSEVWTSNCRVAVPLAETWSRDTSLVVAALKNALSKPLVLPDFFPFSAVNGTSSLPPLLKYLPQSPPGTSGSVLMYRELASANESDFEDGSPAPIWQVAGSGSAAPGSGLPSAVRPPQHWNTWRDTGDGIPYGAPPLTPLMSRFTDWLTRSWVWDTVIFRPPSPLSGPKKSKYWLTTWLAMSSYVAPSACGSSWRPSRGTTLEVRLPVLSQRTVTALALFERPV